MKERLIEIMRLAYEINERFQAVYVSIDYNKGMGTLVRVNDLREDRLYVYSGKAHATDTNLYTSGIYISDEGFKKALNALHEILEGVRV